MFNNEQQAHYTSSLSPRISFSDFADTQQAIKHDSNYREAPVSSDFGFSVTKDTMIPADEIFFKGMLLTAKDNCTNQLQKTTLRDELLVDDESEDPLPVLSKSSDRWKERLGLKKAHIVSRKGNKSDGVLETVVKEKIPVFVHEVLVPKKTETVD